MTDIKYYTSSPDTTDYGVVIGETTGRSFSVGEESYTRVFKASVPQVPVEDEHYGPVVVANELRRQLAITKGSAYVLPSGETSSTAFCTDIRITQDSNEPSLYSITVEYGLPSWGAATSPLTVPVSYSWTSEYVELPLVIDFDPTAPKPVWNSATDLFEEPVRTAYSRRVLTVRRNENAHAALTSATYENKCNSDTWNGLAPYTVLCRSISSEHVVDQSVASGGYDSVTYVFVFDLIFGHKIIRADAGWQILEGGVKKKIHYDGFEPSQIPLLDGNGALLPDTDDPVDLEFYPYEAISFGTTFNWISL